jgi:CRP/FNR family cyclic AMP-dependent transcriptional regulator
MRLGRGEEEEPEILQFLKRVPLFSGLDDKALKTLIKETREVSYPEGKVIMREGDPSMVFHLVLDGQVEVRKKKRTLVKIGRGQFFGELGLLDDEPRTADVVAVAPTRCLAMTTWAWRGYLKTTPTMAFEVLRVLARRLRETDKALAE